MTNVISIQDYKSKKANKIEEFVQNVRKPEQTKFESLHNELLTALDEVNYFEEFKMELDKQEFSYIPRTEQYKKITKSDIEKAEFELKKSLALLGNIDIFEFTQNEFNSLSFEDKQELLLAEIEKQKKLDRIWEPLF